jgi:hypothetical protein
VRWPVWRHRSRCGNRKWHSSCPSPRNGKRSLSGCRSKLAEWVRESWNRSKAEVEHAERSRGELKEALDRAEEERASLQGAAAGGGTRRL